MMVMKIRMTALWKQRAMKGLMMTAGLMLMAIVLWMQKEIGGLKRKRHFLPGPKCLQWDVLRLKGRFLSPGWEIECHCHNSPWPCY
jgi:hypothetical protein